MTEFDTEAHYKKTLEIEANALNLLAENMPADFPAVVDLILETKGRVIVCGIGKSGHVGNKITATLASTGTPASFVHASEASHGDLGMITQQDVCILISNSGETRELHDAVAHTRRFNIPMVAISSRPDSTLMQAADYKLTLPDAAEACSIGMAPTTSTTMTMALGDALAVVLMRRRRFMPEQFKVFHPGGKLGAELATVAQLMHSGDDLPVVSADTPMPDVLLEMTSKGFGITGVLENGILIGVVSDGDLRRNMANLMGKNAGEVATKTPVTTTPSTLAAEVLSIMNTKKISAIFAVDDNATPVGLIHVHDLLRAGVS